jgi:hypothetical protein
LGTLPLPLLFILNLVVVAATAAHADVPAPTQGREVEAKLEVLKRILPDGPAVASGVVGLQRTVERAALASSLRLEGVSTVPHPEITAEGVGYLPVELAVVVRPVGDSEHVGAALVAFLSAVGRSARLTTFERLALEAPGDGSLHLSALVRLYYLPPASPLLQGEALVDAKVSLVARSRPGSHWPARYLQALSQPGVPSIFLTALSLEGQHVSAQGVAPWPAQAREWATLVDLDLKSLEWTQPDACQHFSVEGRFARRADEGAPTPKEPAEGPAFLLGGPLEHCAPAARSPRQLPAVRLSSQGPLSLRGRDLDLLDLVLLLAHAAGEAVVVDNDVAGRVDVELMGVTFEAAMGALESLDVYMSPPGRIRRVSLGRRPEALSSAPGSGSPVTVWFRRGRLADMFALLGDISGDGVLIPPDALPTASICASEMPWDVVYQALATSAGLSLRHESGLYRVEREGLSRSRLVGAVGRTAAPRTGLPALTGDQIELSALTASGKAWTAWMLTPHGALLDYKASDRFWNGHVVSVDSRGVDLRIDISDPLSKERFRTRRLDLAPGS